MKNERKNNVAEKLSKAALMTVKGGPKIQVNQPPSS